MLFKYDNQKWHIFFQCHFDFDFAYALTMVFICFDLLRIHQHKKRTEKGQSSEHATKTTRHTRRTFRETERKQM